MIRSQIEEKQKFAQSRRGSNTGIVGLVDDDGTATMVKSRRVNRRRSLAFTENLEDPLRSGQPGL